MKGILFVDDEIQILKSLTRLFFDTDYNIFTAENGEEALKILGNEEIHMVISDMRMPSMDGFQLLSKVKSLYPKVLRIMLSGYSDEKIIIKALQKNIAKLYIFKPWNNDMLIKMVDNIFETEKLLNSSDLLLLINNLDELPTIKTSFQRIIDLIENDAEIAEVSHEIEKDPSISTTILRVANSAFYGVKTGSVRQAVTYLGMLNIRSLIFSTSIMDSMGINGPASSYAEKLWEHAFLTNRILHFLYEKCILKDLAETSRSAGLLHDIGIIFMLKFFTKNYLSLRMEAERENLNALELEQKEFKVTHQETGGYLMKWWDLPFPIVESALYHHRPLDPNVINKELVSAVNISQHYARNMMKMPCRIPISEEVFESVGMPQQAFEEKLAQSFRL